MNGHAILWSIAAVVALGAGKALSAAELPTGINDQTVTESTLAVWHARKVKDLSLSDEARVGKQSVVGTFHLGSRIGLSAKAGTKWDLTKYGKVTFWAKADPGTGGLLVMLVCANDFRNRRDGYVTVTPEWKHYELPLTAERFRKLRHKDFGFGNVTGLAFYQNTDKPTKLWIDGLTLVPKDPATATRLEVQVGKLKKPESKKPKQQDETPASPPAIKKTVRLQPADPAPHREQAERDKYEEGPPYDIPPRGFNEYSFFKDALVSFDEIKGWSADLHNCEGFFCLSEDMPIRGVPNAKIEVKLTGKKPRIAVKPSMPIRIDRAFDVVDMWFYGHTNNPGVGYTFRQRDGTLYEWRGRSKAYAVPGRTNFWNLLRVRLPKVIEKGAELVSIDIWPAEQDKNPTLFHIDQLRVSLFSEYMKRPRPRFENKGPIVKIPVDENCACPKTVGRVRTSVRERDGRYHLTYVTEEGERVSYVYTPKTGTLADLSIEAEGRARFRPAVESGPVFDFGGQVYDAAKGEGGSAELVDCRIEGKRIIAAWNYTGNGKSQTVMYVVSLRGKTLQVEAASEETYFVKWKFGYAADLPDYKVIEIPFMSGRSPKVLVTQGLFVTYYADWYKSNVSTIPNVRLNRKLPAGCVQYSFGDRDGAAGSYDYLKRTDGSRHPLKECFYISASANFDDVMLSISNPPSPMKPVLKKNLYKMVTAHSGFVPKTHALLDLYQEYGMTKIYFLYHVRLLFKRRMGCDPFPGADTTAVVHEPEGGDGALIGLFNRMRGLGMRPGYYDGYKSRWSPHKWFRYDWCTLRPDGNWSFIWGPAFKPWAFPEHAATHYRERARKFGAQVAYQDGWTSSVPFSWNDYDHRYPESGKFIDTLRALGTGWQRVRENMEGPVFSEGSGSDFYTAGLVDGDYGRLPNWNSDKLCHERRDALLVDFRLKKLGPLQAPVGINFGLGGYTGVKGDFGGRFARKEATEYFHHCLATEIAFATIVILEPYWCLFDNRLELFDKVLTCYFMTQQLQERYIMEEVAEIKYFDGERLISTSDALRTDAYKDNRVYVRYKNGLTLYINVNWDGKHWTVTDRGRTYELPPGGWYAQQGDDFIEFSGVINGKRVDFVDSPSYVYLDGHGASVEVNGHKAVDQYIKFKTGPKAGIEIVYPQE